MLREVVVVGGSLAGLRAVESLRSGGYEGSITVIGAEPHQPYDRPPLSKRLLSGEWEADRIALRKPDDMGSLDATWRLGVAATGLDLDRRAVQLADGAEVAFDGLIIATGTSPRRLPGQTDHAHVTELRGLDDALDLRARIAGGDQRVAIIGAGFIGLEVAATARELGNDVVVLEGAEAPLMRGLGAEMGAAVAAVHADHDVEIRCNTKIEGFGDGVVLVDGGWHEECDVVVVGIGVVPETAWLEGSGLTLDNGVRCAPDLSTGVPGVYAAGDIVHWHNPLYDEDMRIEHWTNAAEQGALAAGNLLAEDAQQETTPYAPVPFVWSEQYDRRIQFLGHGKPGDEPLIVAGSVEERKFAALYRRGDRLSGVLGVNMPRHVMPFRNQLLERVSWDDAVAFARSR